MSKIRERRKYKDTCPNCNHPDYKVLPRDPAWEMGYQPYLQLQCTSCGHIWSRSKKSKLDEERLIKK